MTMENFKEIFTAETLETLFPKEHTNQFFDALFGDADEGAYDISLQFKEKVKNELRFEFHLNQRPGKCLVCSLTYGLPEVFSRHPIINIRGIYQEIEQLLKNRVKCRGWQLGTTQSIAKDLHVIPFTVILNH